MRAVIVVLAIALMTVVMIGSSAAAPRNNLAARWHFDEGRGTSIRDSSGHGADGTIVSGTSWVAGRFGSALGFDGNNGSVVVKNSPVLEPASAVTVSAWVKSGASPGAYRYIVAKGASHCTTASYGLYTGPNGGLVFYLSTTHGSAFVRSRDAGTGVWNGAWHFAVGTFDGSVVRLYVDGREIGHGVQRAGKLDYGLENSNDLFIGDYPACQPATFNGEIDEVSIWRAALTGAEIKTAYDNAVGEGGNGQSPTGPGGGGSGGESGQAPSIWHLSMSPSAFRFGAHRMGRTGTTVSYTDTEAARSTFTVLARKAGVRVHGRCVARSRHAGRMHAAHCLYYRRVATFVRKDVAGRNHFRFTRLRGHKLSAGRHRLDVTPRAHGLVGRTTSVRFVVKR